jgi:adenylate cyclase
MAKEIERKFLVKGDAWRGLGETKHYRQGYIETGEAISVSYEGGVLMIRQGDLVEAIEGGPDLSAFLNEDGQINSDDGNTIRVRIAGSTGYFTLKTQTIGISRDEFEVRIELEQAKRLLDQVCNQPQVEKMRSRIAIGDLVWEVDEFLGSSLGLIIAEVELKAADQVVLLPDWVGEEVSSDRRYFNSYLAKNPFCTW